ncbi:MAG TPA: hypothetical protein VGH13_00625, partial [Xanthobacteraceae bacterium]
MPLLGIDQAFIENFQNVGFDIAEPEASGLLRNVADEFVTGGMFQRPVEKVGFDRTDDAFVGQRAARQKIGRTIHRQIEHPRRDRLYDDCQISVLQEQRIFTDLIAIGFGKQPVPEIALELDFGVVTDGLPDRFQHQARAPERHAVATERLDDGAWLRQEVRRIGDEQLKPGQKLVRPVGIGIVFSNLVQSIVAQ